MPSICNVLVKGKMIPNAAMAAREWPMNDKISTSVAVEVLKWKQKKNKKKERKEKLAEFDRVLQEKNKMAIRNRRERDP